MTTTETLLSGLLANGPLARDQAPYRIVEVAGPDAGDFLQRLCSQDVLALAEGALAPAAFLDGKGKLRVTCLAFRLDGAFGLEVQAEQAGPLLELLERFHFTEKLTFAASAAECRERIERAPRSGPGAVARRDGVLALGFARRGVGFLRTYGGDVDAARAVGPVGGDSPAAPRPLTVEAAECLRMLAGLVRVGVDTEPRTLALEADLDDHISATKGCYTGQEIVARVYTYGHVNRRLCLLWLAPGDAITAPLSLHEPTDQAPVGRVMHAIALPPDVGSGRLGTGYLPTDFQAIGTKLALADGTAVEVLGYEPLAR